MRRTRRFVATLSALAVLAAPAFADVIPSRYDDEDAAQDTVVRKLTDMGLEAPDARARVRNLTEDELAYFNGDANRIQLSGQEIWAGQADMMWYEWIGGIIALGGAIGVIVIAANDD